MTRKHRMHDLCQDLRFASGTLRGGPGFALVAVATVGIGIGGNTAVFAGADPIVALRNE